MYYIYIYIYIYIHTYIRIRNERIIIQKKRMYQKKRRHNRAVMTAHCSVRRHKLKKKRVA